MEPKFQSSFIPKGSSTPAASVSPAFSSLAGGPPPAKSHSIIGILAGLLFVVAILLSGGVVAYKYYLNSHINSLGVELGTARQSLEPNTINDLVRLNARLVSTKSLINDHTVLSPFFDFLESSTTQGTQFTSFNFTNTAVGASPTVTLQGVSRSYTSLAQQAGILTQSSALSNVDFSNLLLDDKGNVSFSLTANVNPAVLSYENEIKTAALASTTLPVFTTVATTTTATTTATTTQSKK